MPVRFQCSLGLADCCFSYVPCLPPDNEGGVHVFHAINVYQQMMEDQTSSYHDLTHLPLDKMVTISHAIFSNAFSWMKMYESRSRFQWVLFLSFELTIFQHLCRQWLVADQATSHYVNQWWLVYWRIYASLGLHKFPGPILKKQINTLTYHP